MRYIRGNKVEVFSQKEVPSGSWRGAEIICGDGHSYTVQYDTCAKTADEVIFERVSRRVIRPCPPISEVPENWVPGDIVEVFDNFCWKMATISKVLSRRCFLVRLLGSLQEFKVHKAYLRHRFNWQDGKWVVSGKGSRDCGNHKHTEQSTIKFNKISSSLFRRKVSPVYGLTRDDSFASRENMNVHEIQNGSSRTLKKRGLYYDSPVEASGGAAYKYRLISGRCGVKAAVKTFLPEKVAVASSREMVAETNEHASLKNRTIFSEMDMERLKPSAAVRNWPEISLEPNDSYSVSRSSVGSCSISGSVPYELPYHSSTCPIDDTDGYISDAQSACQRDEEEDFFLPTEKELAEEIHSLELHAYRCTMEALHASGPLSWEQETLVTNLRLSLHISNDEHLSELRNLVSAETSIPIK